MVNVPAATSMNSETFRKHLEFRHIPAGDFADLKAIRPGVAFEACESTFHAYHRYLHERNGYEHTHAATP